MPTSPVDLIRFRVERPVVSQQLANVLLLPLELSTYPDKNDSRTDAASFNERRG
jgi:hypothetical protein